MKRVRSPVILGIFEASNCRYRNPLMEDIEGTGNAPAYRGTAYVGSSTISRSRSSATVFGSSLSKSSARFGLLRGVSVTKGRDLRPRQFLRKCSEAAG